MRRIDRSSDLNAEVVDDALLLARRLLFLNREICR
jgi:hypothetical protein